MEIIIAVLAQQFIPILGTVLAGLASWGLSILKSKTEIIAAKSALDQVNQVVQTVVGGLTQTVAGELKKSAADGNLSDADKQSLKQAAIDQTKALLSTAIVAAAGKTIVDLEGYVSQRIEAQVLSLKK